MKFNIMDRTGHSTELLATKNEQGVVDAAETAKAMARFTELVRDHGMIAAKRTGQGTSEVIKAFDPNAEEIIFVPKLQGG